MSVTLYDKLWNEHLVKTEDSNESLVYIDRHYLHEVTSPQAFEGLRHKKLSPWRLDANIATPDHNVPTNRGSSFNAESIADEVAKIQVLELDKNCNNFGIVHFLRHVLCCCYDRLFETGDAINNRSSTAANCEPLPSTLYLSTS